MTALADTIIAHYQRHAGSWDADRCGAGWNDKPWHDRFIGLLPKAGRVLDLGCGGGAPVALHLVAHGLAVTGVDSAPALIALCRDRMPDQEWLVADMRTLAVGRGFDGVQAWDSFFHLKPEDQRAMFPVFAAHTSAGAALMFNTGPARGEAIGRYRGDPLYHASLDASEYKALLDEAGFGLIDHAIEDPQAGGRTVWLARKR